MSERSEANDLHHRLARVVAQEIAPMLHLDGNRIEIVGVENGIVQIRLHGVGGCCPSTTQAILMGIEEELRRCVPGVEYLELVV